MKRKTLAMGVTVTFDAHGYDHMRRHANDPIIFRSDVGLHFSSRELFITWKEFLKIKLLLDVVKSVYGLVRLLLEYRLPTSRFVLIDHTYPVDMLYVFRIIHYGKCTIHGDGSWSC
jgi:hypothetical protein